MIDLTFLYAFLRMYVITLLLSTVVLFISVQQIKVVNTTFEINYFVFIMILNYLDSNLL